MSVLPLYDRWYADRDFAGLRDERRAACALPVAWVKALIMLIVVRRDI
jgi:hypothetical protein